jgi:hypothetical protein
VSRLNYPTKTDQRAAKWLRGHDFHVSWFAGGWLVAWPDGHTFTKCPPGHVSDFVVWSVGRGRLNVNYPSVRYRGDLPGHLVAGVFTARN